MRKRGAKAGLLGSCTGEPVTHSLAAAPGVVTSVNSGHIISDFFIYFVLWYPTQCPAFERKSPHWPSAFAQGMGTGGGLGRWFFEQRQQEG